VSNDNDKQIIGPWVHRFPKISLLCFRFLFGCFVVVGVVVSCAFPPPNHFSQDET